MLMYADAFKKMRSLPKVSQMARGTRAGERGGEGESERVLHLPRPGHSPLCQVVNKAQEAELTRLLTTVRGRARGDRRRRFTLRGVQE